MSKSASTKKATTKKTASKKVVKTTPKKVEKKESDIQAHFIASEEALARAEASVLEEKAVESAEAVTDPTLSVFAPAEVEAVESAAVIVEADAEQLPAVVEETSDQVAADQPEAGNDEVIAETVALLHIDQSEGDSQNLTAPAEVEAVESAEAAEVTGKMNPDQMLEALTQNGFEVPYAILRNLVFVDQGRRFYLDDYSAGDVFILRSLD